MIEISSLGRPCTVEFSRVDEMPPGILDHLAHLVGEDAALVAGNCPSARPPTPRKLGSWTVDSRTRGNTDSLAGVCCAILRPVPPPPLQSSGKRDHPTLRASTTARPPAPFLHVIRDATFPPHPGDPAMTDLVDNFGRAHDTLRVSVTDRCNLRCRYCMPEEGIDCHPGRNSSPTSRLPGLSRSPRSWASRRCD